MFAIGYPRIYKVGSLAVCEKARQLDTKSPHPANEQLVERRVCNKRSLGSEAGQVLGPSLEGLLGRSDEGSQT